MTFTSAWYSITSAMNWSRVIPIATMVFSRTPPYALTRLPAGYYRHHIDMAFYLAPGEREEMLRMVKDAVDDAAEFIYQRRQAGAD